MAAMPFVHHLISGAIDYLTNWDSPANKLPFPTRRHFYYALVRTLHEGSEATPTHSARPPLPLELIIQILRDAECTVLSRLSCHVEGRPTDDLCETSLRAIFPQGFLGKEGWPLPLINGKEIYLWKETGGLCNIMARDASPIREVWFSTSPLSAHDLANTHSTQLLTLSGDQGWVSDPHAGSWSWFDVVLIPSEREGLDGEEPSWFSHNNSPPASIIQPRAGSIFGPSHDLWQIAQIGNRIGVRACAQFNGWKNIATQGLLIIQEYFIPSFVPR